MNSFRTNRPNNDADAAKKDPRTPVVLAQTKKIDTTSAECPDINHLLHRLETLGKIDLQSQLDILASDNILCGIRKYESSIAKKN